eukprot:scaffold11534_cov84-Isochrysis_galbana.AAC.2
MAVSDFAPPSLLLRSPLRPTRKQSSERRWPKENGTASVRGQQEKKTTARDSCAYACSPTEQHLLPPPWLGGAGRHENKNATGTGRHENKNATGTGHHSCNPPRSLGRPCSRLPPVSFCV